MLYHRTFLMSPLHSLSLKMWILIYYMSYFWHFESSYMCYCVDGGHLGRHLEFNPFCPWSRLSTQVFFTYLGVHYQHQESKWGDIWLHTGPPSAPGLLHLALFFKVSKIFDFEWHSDHFLGLNLKNFTKFCENTLSSTNIHYQFCWKGRKKAREHQTSYSLRPPMFLHQNGIWYAQWCLEDSPQKLRIVDTEHM